VIEGYLPAGLQIFWQLNKCDSAGDSLILDRTALVENGCSLQYTTKDIHKRLTAKEAHNSSQANIDHTGLR